jgi:glycosyltransferase involved in cell wall biosynthesis/GT2 family glycosyltransferase
VTRKADVVIPVYTDVAVTRACIESVLQFTGDELGRLVVVNDCSPDPAMRPMLEELRSKNGIIELLSNEANLGFVASVNRGIGITQRDVVLLNSDTLVTPGWLEEMLAVACENDRIAAVAPLSNNGAICSVPEYCQPVDRKQLLGADLALLDLPSSTIVPTGVGFCLLLKRTVLNMIGGFDSVYGRGYNEENDWAMRAQTLGFVASRANRALVYHLGSISFGDQRADLDRRTGEILLNRYPYYLWEVAAFSKTPASRIAAHQVSRRLGSFSACVNIRHLNGMKINGTGVHAIELVKCLRQHTSIDVSVHGATPEQSAELEVLGVKTRAANVLERVQIFHHPAQIFAPEDLRLFLSTPSHAVISFLDLISWRTPSTHASVQAFERYKTFCFAALQSAQAVIATSEHNRSEIVNELHVAPENVWMVPLGVDQAVFEKRDETRNRDCLEKFKIRPQYFLYIGSDYAHKNLKLLMASYAVFRQRFASARKSKIPSLVLVGSPSGSAGSLYDLLSEVRPPGVGYLGTVTETDVRALLQEASALVFPTAYEGFGLPVLEAMASGTPVICSSLTSVPEIAGDAALYINDFTPDEIASHMLSVISSASLRQRLIDAGRARAHQFSWKETARKIAIVYETVVARPSVETLFRREMFATLMRGGFALAKKGAQSNGDGSTASRTESDHPSLLDRLRDRLTGSPPIVE